MLSNDQIEALRPRINQFRIVLAALIGGVAVLGAVVLLIGNGSFPTNFSTLSLVFLGVSVVIVTQAFIIPGIVRNSTMATLTKDPDPDADLSKPSHDAFASQQLGVWFTSTLISVAMLESAALINLVGTYIEKNNWHLVAAGVILVLMLSRFPSEDRVISWIEARIRDRERGV